MSDSLYRTTMRTHACGELTAEHVDAAVVLCGWVASRRDHGGVTFIDLRDREGIVQIVFHPEDAADAHAAAQRLGAEDVVRVTGSVRARPDGMTNLQLRTGEVELAAASLEILSEADTPPFPIEDRIEAGEELRLRYRYLDLRRQEMTEVLRIRHSINAITRDHMESLGFLEVETPMLTRSTPEGARDFLVPSRVWPGTFYALPQSPQQLKQLLMVAGQDRYYQIVRCLRDEAPRADRSFEFTQLDVEMSFADQEDVFAVIEPLYARYVREIRGVEVETPFPRIPYDEMLARFGTDKPDLRYGMELADLAPVFDGTGFNAFGSVLATEDGAIKGLAAPGGGQLSRKELDQLVQDAKGRGAAGLVWMVVEAESVRSPVEKHLSKEEVDGTLRATDASEGDLVCIVADQIGRANVALDGVRRNLADRLGLIPEGEWRYAWYTDPPLFDWSEEEGKWVANHHPFSAPATDDLDPKTAKAKAYDLVLNGFEVGGGSIRIHRPEVQRKVFEVLGLSQPEIEEKFGHLLRAFRYGAPPHGGIAMGMDRIVMLMAGKEAIRDVTAFPKAQSGSDPLTGAPAPADDGQLRELGIQVIPPPAKEQRPPIGRE
ncbi:MAG: aspartyl-tRNA synthetase [Actinomycetia bacterium]|jgi:aspartyl-tRNA synthetase|nr:aspartyl-tRNA synthetase [Actinomycetes bacterium]